MLLKLIKEPLSSISMMAPGSLFDLEDKKSRLRDPDVKGLLLFTDNDGTLNQIGQVQGEHVIFDTGEIGHVKKGVIYDAKGIEVTGIVRVEYDVYGTTGPLIMCVNGARQTKSYWKPLISHYLNEQMDFRFIAFDVATPTEVPPEILNTRINYNQLRAEAANQGKKISQYRVSVMKKLIDRIAGNNKAMIMGASWGGKEAADFASIYPESVSKLFLNCFALEPSEEFTWHLEDVRNLLEGMMLKRWRNTMFLPKELEGCPKLLIDRFFKYRNRAFYLNTYMSYSAAPAEMAKVYEKLNKAEVHYVVDIKTNSIKIPLSPDDWKAQVAVWELQKADIESMQIDEEWREKILELLKPSPEKIADVFSDFVGYQLPDTMRAAMKIKIVRDLVKYDASAPVTLITKKSMIQFYQHTCNILSLIDNNPEQEKLKNIKAKTYVVYGDRDKAFPHSAYDKFKTLIKDCVLYQADGAAHFLDAEVIQRGDSEKTFLWIRDIWRGFFKE